MIPVPPDLVSLLRTDGSAESLEATLAGLAAGNAWESLLAEAEAERVGSLLYQVVRPYRRLLPTPAWERLRLLYRSAAVVSMAQVREWDWIVRRLAGDGVEFLVLKGLPLAQELYGDPVLRPMQDLDLLIRRVHLPVVQAALAERGYVPFVSELNPGATERFESEVTLLRADAASGLTYVCEPHWYLVDAPFYQRRISVDWFWQTARPARLGSAHVKVLGREALLLYLCAHLALHHQGAHLLWLCDIDRFLRKGGECLDWDLLLARAGENALVLPLRAVLAQAVDVFGAPLPADLRERLACLQPDASEQKVFAAVTGADPQASGWARFLNYLAQMPGWSARLDYLLVNTFPDRAYMCRRYGFRRGWLLPFFYLRRLAEGAWAALAALRHRRTAAR